jgi:hypothetical protein
MFSRTLTRGVDAADRSSSTGRAEPMRDESRQGITDTWRSSRDVKTYSMFVPKLIVFDASPGMPCPVDLLCDAVISHPRTGVTVPQHVLTPSTDNRDRWTFARGFHVLSFASETWIDNKSIALQHGMPLPFQISQDNGR